VHLLDLSTRNRLVKISTSLEQISRKFNISIRIGETKSVYKGGQAGVSDVFASALWAVDYMFALASYGIIGVNFHTSPIVRYAVIDHSDGNCYAPPLYYGMLLFRIASNGRITPLTQDESSINLSSYAIVQDDGAVVVTMINKSDKSSEIQLSAEGTYNNAMPVWLSVPSLESKSGIRLGGGEVSVGDAWRIANVNEINVSRTDDHFALLHPAASAVAIFLTTPSSSPANRYLRLLGRSDHTRIVFGFASHRAETEEGQLELELSYRSTELLKPSDLEADNVLPQAIWRILA
jgi:hypothetical protein